jgi:PAS domain S-box-containing protein
MVGVSGHEAGPSTEKLSALLIENSIDGILAFDRDLRYTIWNPAMERISGVARSDVIGRVATNVFPYLAETGEDENLRRTLSGESPVSRDRPYVIPQTHREGFYEAHYTPLLSDTGDVVGGVGIVRDVTDRLNLERERTEAFGREQEARRAADQARRESDSFVYAASHDLNGPLISIAGFVDYLEGDLSDRLSDEGRFFIERISSNVSFMRGVIRDLLELSRVGRLETRPENVDLNVLLEILTAEMRAGFSKLSVEADELPRVRMNPLRTRQLFANLLENSVKHSDSPEVRVRVSAQPSGRGFVTVSVADRGPGIPVGDRESVFDVFHRSQPGDHSGTGMGLAICKRIVESIGGRIWIADSDAGTDVQMTLPVTEKTVER